MRNVKMIQFMIILFIIVLSVFNVQTLYATPIAQFVVTAVNPDNSVVFDASSSYETDNNHGIVYYAWDFDNESASEIPTNWLNIMQSFVLEATGSITTHNYLSPGIYYPVLRVQNDQNIADYAFLEVRVNVSSVPEPGILILLSLSMASIVGLRRWWK